MWYMASAYRHGLDEVEYQSIARTSGSIEAVRGRNEVGERVWMLFWWSVRVVDDGKRWEAILDNRDCGPDILCGFAGLTMMRECGRMGAHGHQTEVLHDHF